eukprot:Lankesteria_metandrocarpae@DN2833_c0_g1_i1.p1
MASGAKRLKLCYSYMPIVDGEVRLTAGVVALHNKLSDLLHKSSTTAKIADDTPLYTQVVALKKNAASSGKGAQVEQQQLQCDKRSSFLLLGQPDNVITASDLPLAFWMCRLSFHIQGSLPNQIHDCASYASVEDWCNRFYEFCPPPALPTSTEATREGSSTAPLRIAFDTNVYPVLQYHLRTRTYLVGHSFTLADLLGVAVIVKLTEGSINRTASGGVPSLDVEVIANGLGNSTGSHHVRRWIRTVLGGGPAVAEAVLSSLGVDSKSSTAARQPAGKTDSKSGTGSIAATSGLTLPNAVKGKVVTRFPPEPSGYLHIGHAKAALLNNYFARAYEGKLILRFDDTNPAKEKSEFELSILDDLKVLEVKPDIVSRTSDFFAVLQDYMKQFIEKGFAYVDSTPLEQMRAERGEGIESRCRGQTVADNLRLWNQMLLGSAEGQTCCVRAKIDMQSKNKCMRDPVMYRCVVDIPHHTTGEKYKAYPMYDFACPIVDSLEGVTHAMRTNEYADRIPQYEWVQKAAGVRPVIVYEFSRLNFVNTVLSKRKLQHIVDSGDVEGWEDPRFPTVRGIVRRGLRVSALMEFILDQGPSKNTNLMEWGALWAKNRNVLDPIAPRYMAVAQENGVRVHITGAPEAVESKMRQLHPKNEAMGSVPQYYCKTIMIEQDDAMNRTEGEEVTLMKWGNAIFERIQKIKTADGLEVVSEIFAKLNLDGDVKKTAKLHWVPFQDPSNAQSHDPIRVLIREYDHLITKKKPEDTDTIASIINTNSVFDTPAIADSHIATVKQGDVVQLERRGFFRVDSQDGSTPKVLIKIPDGKTKGMSTVSTKIDAKQLSKGSAPA